jgi:SAM-dependent methyltransferase
MRILSSNNDHYDYFLNEYQNRAKSVGWKDDKKQRIVFDAVSSFMTEKRHASILDVGCGLGDFEYYFKNLNSTINNEFIYKGIDCHKGMVERANRKNIEHIDIRDYEDKTGIGFKYIIAIGTFNLCVENNLTNLKYNIKRMINLSTDKVIISLLTDRHSFGRSGVLYRYDPKDIVDILRLMDLKYSLKNDYVDNDMTICISK